MRNLVVVGLQWGDEGKGKIVDFLAEHFDIIARFQGGSNAGHTVKTNEHTFKFRIIPTGAVRGKTTVIGNGVVIDPVILLDEIKLLQDKGINVDLHVSDRAHVITPYHIQLDELQEAHRTTNKVGTTKRGIGPTYSDKTARIGVRISDLMGPEMLLGWNELARTSRNRIEKVYASEPEHKSDSILRELQQSIKALNDFIGDTGEYLYLAIKNGKRVLFEGAQGALLDIDHGTYPFVTSSNCLSGAASLGTGISPNLIGPTLGIAKTYTTRVGTGPFPTELNDDVGREIQERGGEFGTVTGRPRRCGWLDLVALKYAVRLNGSRYLAITKADVLSNLHPIKVCVGYEYGGKQIKSVPANPQIYERIVPIYEELDGWTLPDGQTIMEYSDGKYDQIPPEMMDLMRMIEHYTESRICLISVGPERNATIQRSSVLNEIV